MLATLIAYPMAYFVVRRLGKRRLLVVMLVIVPLWVSYLVRVYAWKIILGDCGVINTTLLSLGLISEPLTFLLYSRFAVFLVAHLRVDPVRVRCVVCGARTDPGVAPRGGRRLRGHPHCA